VIKALILTKIIHLLISLPNPPNDKIKEIKKMFYDYMWKSKIAKVAKNDIIQSFENGGLRIICLESYCKSLNITWI
jgi:hypothetical protein